jgi:UDP-glucose 4-epimerase|tara:strand:+ start:2274 stop:3263 length:990 start_codon:yes stop_codon:yes gene_type:complete
MKVLITGGAGYIGSHMALSLLDEGNEVVILDNLSTGFKNIIPKKSVFIEGDVGNLELIDKILHKYKFDAVTHFSGSVKVNESISDPFKYYENNTLKTLNFINLLSKSNTKKIIFSSTASVYDPFNKGMSSESAPLNPINPYGASKLMCERMIKDISKSSDFKFFILRYFNVAGADPLERSGQLIDDATHLIKVCVECAMYKRQFLEIYGNDYDTPDGTCIRDFIHVTDLISGHILAIQHLVNGGNSDICNLGYGKGYSVLEIIKKVKSISGYDFPVITSNRREGDAPFSVSNPTKMKSLYNWNPIHNIDDIILSMLNWEKKVNKYPLNE